MESVFPRNPLQMEQEQGPLLSLCPSLNSYSSSSFEINGEDQPNSSDQIPAVDHLDPPPPSDPQDDGSDDSDFSFVCRDADGSPISADEIFSNGRILPVFPVFNRHLLFSDAASAADQQENLRGGGEQPQPRRLPLRKLMKEDGDAFSSSSSESDELEGIPAGTYCVWKPRSGSATPKSNSTGSSKRWRFRDLLRRSSSDGKETFVFLEKERRSAERRHSGDGKRKGKGKDPASTKKEDRRRTFLPYKKEVMGFFVNG